VLDEPTPDPNAPDPASSVTDAAAAAAAAAEPQAGADGDAGNKPNAYELFLALTATDEGKALIGLAAGQVAAPAAEVEPPATQQADPERATLEAAADAGDGEAAIRLRQLDKAAAEDAAKLEPVRQQAMTEGYRSLATALGIDKLTDEEQLRINAINATKGPEAGVAALREALAKLWANGGAPDPDAVAARAAELAAVANGTHTPNLPAATNLGGPPPIEVGKPPAQVFDEYFAYRDQQKAPA